MEQSNNGSLELGTTSSVDGCRAECLPDDVLANVGGDKERDTRSKSVAFLEQLVQGQNDETGTEELGNDENGITSSDRSQISVHSTDNVSNSFSNSDENTKELLSTGEQGAIFLHVVVDLDDTRTCQQLHDKTRRHDGTNSELHQGTSVGSQNDTHPIEWIGGLGTLHSIDWNLTAHQENEEGDGCPEKFLTERDLRNA